MTAPVNLDDPGPDDAYVIRIQGADGHRLKTTISHAEAQSAGDRGLAQELVNKATSLIEVFGIHAGYAPLATRGDKFFYGNDLGEEMVAYAQKWGIEIRPMPPTSGEKPA